MGKSNETFTLTLNLREMVALHILTGNCVGNIPCRVFNVIDEALDGNACDVCVKVTRGMESIDIDDKIQEFISLYNKGEKK